MDTSYLCKVSHWVTYLIQHNHLHLADFGHPFLDEVQDPSWCGNDYMYYIKTKKTSQAYLRGTLKKQTANQNVAQAGKNK